MTDSKKPWTEGPITRGYDDSLRVDWDNGKGGFSHVTLLDATGRPIAILLGDYVPGEIDAEMDANATLYAAAPDMAEALAALLQHRHEEDPHYSLEQVEARARAALSKAGATATGGGA